VLGLPLSAAQALLAPTGLRVELSATRPRPHPRAQPCFGPEPRVLRQTRRPDGSLLLLHALPLVLRAPDPPSAAPIA
jgi:hypothetical protein